MQRIYATYKIITKYRNDTDNPWWGRSPIGRATYIKDWSFSQCERHLTLLAQRVIIRSTLSSFPVMIKSYYSEESLILLQTREFNDIQGIFTLCQTSWIYQMAKMLDIFSQTIWISLDWQIFDDFEVESVEIPSEKLWAWHTLWSAPWHQAVSWGSFWGICIHFYISICICIQFYICVHWGLCGLESLEPSLDLGKSSDRLTNGSVPSWCLVGLGDITWLQQNITISFQNGSFPM